MLSLAPYLLLPLVTALPHSHDIETRGATNSLIDPLAKRAGETWESDEAGGNTEIEVSEHRVDWGDWKPWEIVEEALKDCHSNACLEGSSYTQKTIIIPSKGAKGENAEVTVKVGGLFSKKTDEANIETLSELVSFVFWQLSESEERTSAGVNSCTANGQCQTIGVSTSVQYRTVSAVTITVNDDDKGFEGHVSVSAEIDRGLSADECSDIGGAGQAISTELGGWGGAFSLASLVCKAVVGV